MLSSKKRQEYYQALLNKNSSYEGIFYVGVKTTSVFCRPTCPARKPKLENCDFFETAKEALLASFRPCQRCQPLSHPNQVSEVVRVLVKAIEEELKHRYVCGIWRLNQENQINRVWAVVTPYYKI